ncbi:MAG: hypothetical protein AAFZ80_04365 [Cyanobacteria bacterium P01_A01_bin.105]
MNEAAGSATPQTCPVCGVTIIGDEVQFSNGTPGTRARLYARVCKYANKPDCINKNADAIGTVLKEDGFDPGKDISLS